ncbi:MAG: hypothetical protein R3242_10430 [Akkermansiaceae bacterium]|nr:hypothetical protein [Akkermansiaceae bacterium]
MKILLGAIAALLLASIIVSWQGVNRDKENPTTSQDLALLKEQNELLKENQRLKEQLENSRKPESQGAAIPPSQQDAIEAYQQQLAEQQAAEARRQAEEDAKLKRDEEGLIAQMKLERQDEELRRARLISQALLVGRVTDYADNPEVGGFITIDVLKPELVQKGSILGIRRNNTGILYQFEVSDVYPEGAIANPLTAIGDIKPEKGDELIFPPH